MCAFSPLSLPLPLPFSFFLIIFSGPFNLSSPLSLSFNRFLIFYAFFFITLFLFLFPLSSFIILSFSFFFSFPTATTTTPTLKPKLIFSDFLLLLFYSYSMNQFTLCRLASVYQILRESFFIFFPFSRSVLSFFLPSPFSFPPPPSS